MWRLRTLASQMLLGILGVLLVTTAVGALLYGRLARETLDSQYEERARTAADMVAALADVQRAVAAGDPQNQLQPLAQHLGERAGLTYIVITDRTGLRFSHPNPRLVGQRLEEPVATLDGRDHVGVDNGSLGRSANGKAPIVDASGQVIGQVSVGILETKVASEASARGADDPGVLRLGPAGRHRRRAPDGPGPETAHLRARTPADRGAAAGAGGDAVRHPRGCDRSRHRGPGAPDQRSGAPPAATSTRTR